MDDNKRQDFKRNFWTQPVFVKWSHISTFLAYPDGLFASVPDKQLATGKVRKFSQDYGPNMNCILTFMVNHMDRLNINKLDTDDKDIAQAFFGSQAYIQGETGMSINAISSALSSLVDAGVLIREGEHGKTIFHAFSERTILAIVAYSQKRQELERASNPTNKPIRRVKETPPTVGNDSPDSREWLPRQSGMTPPTVGNGSYIEEPSKENSKESLMDGWKRDSQPAKKSRVSELVGIAQELQQIFDGRSGYIDYATINLALADIVDSANGDLNAARRFVDWTKAFAARKFERGLVWKDWKMAKLVELYREQHAQV